MEVAAPSHWSEARGKSGSRPTNNISQKSHFLEKGPEKQLAIPDLLKIFLGNLKVVKYDPPLPGQLACTHPLLNSAWMLGS